ncbi:caspase family protein [Aestuariivirga sp. YIM B02566]|uniref:Caspase family protein n=1 Tax=Taklimakanibacter albus TaxID=2800327 RepID=A0ACC5QX54_9HYPH|nr:caspase family protein [Aestuariivirga sp. YIM B02566]
MALIIGNSSYAAVPALKNPPTDARAIADTLTSLGFEKVTLKLDLDRQATWAALAEFAEDAARADWAVVYYAGHGIELDAQNYIIPVDAKLDSDRRVLFETIPLDHVVEATAGARKFRLVILDACRNNPFLASMTRVASTRSIGRGLSRVEPQGGVLVAYAAKAGEIALDGDSGNSPFVVALIEQLRRPGVEIGFLFRKVRDSVLRQTNGTQEPYTYGSLPGDEELYFRPPLN